MEKLLKRLHALAGKQELYVVGGWLRDGLLKRSTRDLDLAVSGDPERLARKTARALKGSFVLLDSTHKIYRVVLKNNPEVSFIDFAKMRGKNIASDLAKRDFTVNALAAPVTQSGIAEIIDPFCGRSDLKKRLIRMVSPKIFNDDPLRLLRAFRFAAVLGFTVEPATRRQIKKLSALIKKSAGERVREELFKILSVPSAAPLLQEVENSGVLDAVIPEILPMKRSARKFYYHPLGLWQHARETLESLEYILSSLEKFFPGHHKEVAAHLSAPLSSGITRESLLKLVALLHDAAKPACAKRVGKRMRFLGHEEQGAKMILAILKRIKAGNRETKIARRLVENHMRPISLGQALMVTQRASFRLFRDIGAETPDLIILSLADCYSYRRLKRKQTVPLKKQGRTMRDLMSRYWRQKETSDQPRLVDGHMLMKRFKLKPGPVIGRLLAAIHEARVLGSVQTAAEAFALAEKRLTRLKK